MRDQRSVQSDARARRRRLISRLVIIDVIVLTAIVGVWLAMRSQDADTNVFNGSLRGSLPPAGMTMPDLSSVPQIEPAFPAPIALAGAPAAFAATCMDCRSGDVLGGFLGRLTLDDLPAGAELHVAVWNGDVEAWKREWNIGQLESTTPAQIHVANGPEAVGRARRAFAIGERAGSEESGIVLIYDAEGEWRSSWYLGQLSRDGLRHDLDQLAAEQPG